MASCKCVKLTQRRCRTKKGRLGKACGAASGARRTAKKRKGRCLKTRVEIQNYGPAKRICVKRAAAKR